MRLSCEDQNCQNCQFDLSKLNDTNCKSMDDHRSIQIGRPLIYSWQTSNPVMSFVANVFFHEEYCAFYSQYIEPQVLSTHVNLGFGNGKCESSIDFRISKNLSSIQKAFWVSTHST